MIKAIFTIIALTSSIALAKVPVHSKVTVKAKKSGDKVALDFKVGVVGAIVINDEGPWSLQLKSHDGLKFKKTKFKKADFKKTAADLSHKKIYVETDGKPTKKSGKVEYKMVTFICTKNKEKCFREVHKGSTSWAFK